MKAFKFDSIISLITTFDTEQKCINYLEKQRWPNRVISPYNALSKVYKCKRLMKFILAGKLEITIINCQLSIVNYQAILLSSADAMCRGGYKSRLL